MSIKIVADSACDLLTLDGVDFSTVPLKISTDKTEYVDDAALDVLAMAEALRSYKGRSFSSCPNVVEWEEAYGEDGDVFVFPLTQGLSGSYSAAVTAAEACIEKNPARRIHVFNTLTAGPELLLQIERLQQLLLDGADFDTARDAITAYLPRTHLLFALESMHILAQNGRVSKLIAVTAGTLGIRAVGAASEEGKLAMLGKCRGSAKTITFFLPQMETMGYRGGRVAIGHCDGFDTADAIRQTILAKYPDADVTVRHLRGLCSYYVEQGGILVGFES